LYWLFRTISTNIIGHLEDFIKIIIEKTHGSPLSAFLGWVYDGRNVADNGVSLRDKKLRRELS
jgi:hypothetical protein